MHSAARQPHTLTWEPLQSSAVQPVKLLYWWLPDCGVQGSLVSLHPAACWSQVIDDDMHTTA